MDLSIITAFYHGNKFINNYLKIMNELKTNTKDSYKFEIIIVNDSPEIEVEISEKSKKDLNIKIIKNKENMGIHASRINGYNHSKGKYVLFLDQDDEISPKIINKFFMNEDDSSVYIFNGFFEVGGIKKKIFKNNFSGKFATKELNFLLARDFIVSPGQCIIRKEDIPSDWLKKALNVNGTDDYLLWLLMFNEQKKFKYINEDVYTHKETGENLSSNKEKMNNSLKCLLEHLKKSNYPSQKIKKLEKTVSFKHKYKKEFFKQLVFHPIIFFYNLGYRLIWRGCLINRGDKYEK